MKRWIVAVSIAGVALAAGGLGFMLLQGDRGYDPAFDTKVAEPAEAARHPRVLFDAAHHNVHTIDAGYRPFADLIGNDGYDLEPLKSRIAPGTLSGVSVVVIVGARGTNDSDDGPAFTDTEATAIVDWVGKGGALLLVTDHWPFGTAVAPLAARFGIDMSQGMTTDPSHFEPAIEESHLVFSRENGLLGDHPIVAGRGPTERINRVLTFTGQSLRGPAGATAFLRLADSAMDALPTAPTVTRENGSVRVSMTYGRKVSAAGRAQALAMPFGRGRIVVLGEIGMLRAARERDLAVGMNYPGYDNRQLALNIMHWLSRVI